MQIKYNKISSRCNSALFCVLSLGLLLPAFRGEARRARGPWPAAELGRGSRHQRGSWAGPGASTTAQTPRLGPLLCGCPAQGVPLCVAPGGTLRPAKGETALLARVCGSSVLRFPLRSRPRGVRERGSVGRSFCRQPGVLSVLAASGDCLRRGGEQTSSVLAVRAWGAVGWDAAADLWAGRPAPSLWLQAAWFYTSTEPWCLSSAAEQAGPRIAGAGQ